MGSLDGYRVAAGGPRRGGARRGEGGPASSSNSELQKRQEKLTQKAKLLQRELKQPSQFLR